MLTWLSRYWNSLRAARDANASRSPAAVAQAIQLTAEEIDACLTRATEHLALDEREDARDCYELALAHAPDCLPARLGFARMLRKSDESAVALEHLQHALSLAPLDPEVHFELALTRNRAGDVQGAVAAYQRALELEPDYAAASTNLGLIYLSQLGDAHLARRYFERATASDPGSVAAQVNLGLALDEQGQSDAAIAHYERLITAHPEETEYRWHRGLVLLGSGDYARGWDDYELRDARATGKGPRVFPFPVWQGGALREGAALLVYAEQGIGDEIMFASCVPDLLDRGVNCIIECDRRLAALFARSFPAARVYGAARDGGRSWLAQFPAVELQISIAGLPRILRRSAVDFPRHAGYLRADPGRVAAWRTRLAGRTGGHKVGITWGGGTAGTRRALRSLEIRELAPLLKVPGITCVNLQRGAGAALAEFASAQGAEVLTFDEVLEDIDETAALMQALDGVITADNSIAHLAGALGLRASVMLPQHADWRWMQTVSGCSWYPSLTLCRQARTGDWAAVIDNAIAALALPSGDSRLLQAQQG